MECWYLAQSQWDKTLNDWAGKPKVTKGTEWQDASGLMASFTQFEAAFLFLPLGDFDRIYVYIISRQDLSF